MKTAIIGAGVCGLYLAWKLSERGHEVVVFEKEKTAGNKVCSGLFSERILDFVPLSSRLIENKITSVYLNFPKKKIRVGFSKNFLVMDHSELDKMLLGLAEKAGAKIIFSKNVTSMPEGFDKIIGCDGGDSFVRKSLKLPEPKFFLGIQTFIGEKAAENFVETWPVPEGGFIWKIPRVKESEYGIMAEPSVAGKKLNDFLQKRNIPFGNIKAKIIPQGFIIPKNKSITLCGDSAGLTKPWSGGGVVWGLNAANLLLENFPDFLAYRAKAKKLFIPNIIFSKAAKKIIYFLGFNIPQLLPKNNKIESDFLYGI